MIIRALSTLDHAVEELTIHPKDFGISHRIFMAPTEDYTHLCNVLQNLRKIDLSLNMHGGEQLWHQETMGRGLLRDLLARAPLLDSMSLSNPLVEQEYAETPLFDFSLVLGGTDWPRLRSFSVRGFDLTDHYGLTRFLVFHRRT